MLDVPLTGGEKSTNPLVVFQIKQNMKLDLEVTFLPLAAFVKYPDSPPPLERPEKASYAFQRQPTFS